MTRAPQQVEEPYIVGGIPRREGSEHTVSSPFDGQRIGHTWLAPRAQIDTALSSAASAHRTCRRLPSYERARICREIAGYLARDREELALLITAEAGKPVRSSQSEVERAILCFETAAAEATRLDGEMLPLDVAPGADQRWGISRRVPLGPVLAITPFNFPLNLVAHKLAPAIALGAPVVLKPAPQAPLSALRLCRYLLDAGWPPSALSAFVVDEADHKFLVTDDRVEVLSFTGSDEVGWALKSIAGRKRVLLELGGNAAVIVDRDVDVAHVASRICHGGFGYSGQACISVQRVLAHPAVEHILIDELTARVKDLQIGNPMDPITDVGPMISAAATTRALGRVNTACDCGAQCVVGGHALGERILAPTILMDTPTEVAAWREEMFAPVIAVGPATEDFRAALALVNDSRFGLQAGLFTNRLDHALLAFEELDVGAVILNDIPTWRVDPMPYGGMKWSGAGREGIRYAIDEYSERKLLVVNGENHAA